MRWDTGQLETLLAIVEEGSFDGAARRLHLTPSAVSQRVRALEGMAGQVLLRRTIPVGVTEAGAPLLRLARQLRTLMAEAGLGESEVVELAVAVNADSLATWFRSVFGAVARRPGVALRIAVEDEGHSHELVRRGEVVAAVTAEPRPVQGCSVEPLGAMRYRAAIAPDLLAAHRRGNRVDWPRIPLLVFNEKDRLQDVVLAARGQTRPAVVHRIPSTADFLEAVRSGLGWGMLPDLQLAAERGPGAPVPMPGTRPVDVELFWQRWRLPSETLDALSDDVRAAARGRLRPPQA